MTNFSFNQNLLLLILVTQSAAVTLGQPIADRDEASSALVIENRFARTHSGQSVEGAESKSGLQADFRVSTSQFPPADFRFESLPAQAQVLKSDSIVRPRLRASVSYEFSELPDLVESAKLNDEVGIKTGVARCNSEELPHPQHRCTVSSNQSIHVKQIATSAKSFDQQPDWNQFDELSDVVALPAGQSTLKSGMPSFAESKVGVDLPNSEGLSHAAFWWPELVVAPIELGEHAETMSPTGLLEYSLATSPKIKSISQNPLIRELQVIEADAEFDPVLFTRNLYEDRTDPVGNTLTTGGADFLKDHIFSSDSGIRRKLRTGADVEVSQRLGFQNSNSTFFVPQDQGTATLAINISQPLLRGGGRYYNQIQIMLAQSAGGIAWDTLAIELQDELREILSIYWQLYLERASYLQKRESLNRGMQILKLLENRRELDSLPSQIARARSAVESRRTAMANALRDVKNTEVRIRQIAGDREGLMKQFVEIVPATQPVASNLQIPLQVITQTALANRPEVREAMKRVRIAALQLDMRSNDLLPALSLLMGSYVSGLEGGTGIERAFVEQFSNTTPGYSLGLDFELPYRNRAAKSRFSQGHLQLKQLQQDLETIILQVVAESQIAYRSVKTALATLESSKIAIDAARQDLTQQLKRFETFALIEGDLIEGQSPTTVLNLLIDAQDRLMSAEGVYSQTMFDLQLAYIALNRATGTLLQHCNVAWELAGDLDGAHGPNLSVYSKK